MYIFSAKAHFIYGVPNVNSSFEKNIILLKDSLDLEHCMTSTVLENEITILYTVWEFSNLPTTLILREINVSRFLKAKNCHFKNFGGIEFWFLGISHLKMSEIPQKTQNSELLRRCKWQLLGLLKWQNWFHVISEW